MPRDKNFKRLVRERMAKTGESYVTARAHFLARQEASPATEVDLGPMFTWELAPALVLARDEARLRDSATIRPSHILLGLLDRGGPAVAALMAMKVSTAALRADVDRRDRPAPVRAISPVLHDESKQLLALAVVESRERGDRSVGDVSLLLALAASPGPAREALAACGASEERLRQFFEDAAAADQ